jgi:hypothetical protein
MPVLTLLTELAAGSEPGTLRLVVALLIVPASAVLVVAQRRRAAPTASAATEAATPAAGRPACRMTWAVTHVGSTR